MLTMRHMFGVRDARGDVPPAPRLHGDIEGGGRVSLEFGGMGVGPQVRRRPHKVHHDETSARYIVDEGEGEAFAKRMKARFERRHGEGCRVDTQVERIKDGERQASVPISLPLTLWPRFGAKLGLAFGRDVLGDDWVRSEDAARLRRVLLDSDDAPTLPPLWDQVEEDDPFTLLAPRRRTWSPWPRAQQAAR